MIIFFFKNQKKKKMNLEQESNYSTYDFAIDSFFEPTNIDNDFPFYVDPFEKIEIKEIVEIIK